MRRRIQMLRCESRIRQSQRKSEGLPRIELRGEVLHTFRERVERGEVRLRKECACMRASELRLELPERSSVH